MKNAIISFESFEVLQRLKKNFIVVFVSSWSEKSRPHASILSTISSDVVIFEILVGASSRAEDYCIDTLLTKDLPIACVYAGGSLWQSFEYDEMHSLPMIVNGFGPIFTSDQLLSVDLDKSIDVLDALFPVADAPNVDEPIYIFISGDRSSVGKSTTCLALLASLVNKGVSPSMLAYIKPVTQCEATQPVVTYCERMGITQQGIGPVVFYKGFTRAYLAGETDTSEQLIQSAVSAVRSIGRGKQFVLIDGVGYPAVGSICNISNADVALTLQVPVLLVGKEGVGDAVDSFNLNAAFFEIKGVTVLGGIFNKLPLSGFYSLEACQAAVSSYFQQFKPAQFPYGFVPVVSSSESQKEVVENSSEMEVVVKPFEDLLAESFSKYVDVSRLMFDTWKFNKILRSMQTVDVTHVPPPTAAAVVSLPKLPAFPSIAAQTIFSVSSSSPAKASVVPTLTSPQRSVHAVVPRIPSTVAVKPMELEPIVQVKSSGLKRSREEVEREAASQGAKGG